MPSVEGSRLWRELSVIVPSETSELPDDYDPTRRDEALRKILGKQPRPNVIVPSDFSKLPDRYDPTQRSQILERIFKEFKNRLL